MPGRKYKSSIQGDTSGLNNWYNDLSFSFHLQPANSCVSPSKTHGHKETGIHMKMAGPDYSTERVEQVVGLRCADLANNLAAFVLKWRQTFVTG
ncbi:hypothetical protein SAY86_011267 [Trapa natans]|uniref:Uncharacterized protein n=1 Tax=Trapa natans TaxID=22666 RepID=A0AAN7LLV1_TRANT|nr:hypothetical protein SAY86_011267 [Trapa natans]